MIALRSERVSNCNCKSVTRKSSSPNGKSMQMHCTKENKMNHSKVAGGGQPQTVYRDCHVINCRVVEDWEDLISLSL